jgi:hypothetical protein
MKNDAQRLAAVMTFRALTASVARVCVAEVLDLWAEDTKAFSSLSTESNHVSRISGRFAGSSTLGAQRRGPSLRDSAAPKDW